MQRREFLLGGLLFGSTGLLLGRELSTPVAEPVLSGVDKRLFHAIIDGKIEAVEDLIRNGVNVNAKGDTAWTALHLVVGLGSTDPVVDRTVLKLLIDNGADVNDKTDDGNTPLHEAAAWRSVDMVEFLVSNGADISVEDMYGVTPLDLAWIRFEDDKTKENAVVFEYLTDIVDKKLCNSAHQCPSTQKEKQNEREHNQHEHFGRFKQFHVGDCL